MKMNISRKKYQILTSGSHPKTQRNQKANSSKATNFSKKYNA